MSSNYPPGVTGCEDEIIGMYTCEGCDVRPGHMHRCWDDGCSCEGCNPSDADLDAFMLAHSAEVADG